MRRSAYVATLALAALILAGCAASPSAAGTASSSTTPTADETFTPTPTSDPDDPAPWIVSDGGIGPLVLGMPLEDALAHEPDAEEYCGPGSTAAGLVFDTDLLMLDSRLSDGSALDMVVSYEVDGPRTAEGIGVGATTVDVLAAYPDAETEYFDSAFLRVGNIYFGYRANDAELESGQLVDDGTAKPIREVAVTEDGSLLFEFCG